MQALVIKGVSPTKESLALAFLSKHVTFGLKRNSISISAVLVGLFVLTRLWNVIKVLFQFASYQVSMGNFLGPFCPVWTRKIKVSYNVFHLGPAAMAGSTYLEV